MDFCRGAAALPGLRGAFAKRSYWDDHIAVGRIQLALGAKLAAPRNLGYGKDEIIYDDVPDGVFDLAPPSFFFLRGNGSDYELMEGESGANRPDASNSSSR